jgi:hypothetical protein
VTAGPPGPVYAPAANTVLADTYEVSAAIVYPDDAGAINVAVSGRRNDTGEPVTLHVTFDPEMGVALARDLRQAFLRVPMEKRHAR